jgi:hypothetical protein
MSGMNSSEIIWLESWDAGRLERLSLLASQPPSLFAFYESINK